MFKARTVVFKLYVSSASLLIYLVLSIINCHFLQITSLQRLKLALTENYINFLARQIAAIPKLMGTMLADMSALTQLSFL